MPDKAVPEAPTRSLHRKLAQVMWEAERIPKNGTAPREMGGYKFVQVGDAADYIRKALAEKVITMMPTGVQVVAQNEHATLKGGTITTVELITEWTLTDGESGESITIMSYGAGADVGDKYSGKASTSAMKYALLTGFLLSTGEDSEAGPLPERRPPPAHDEPVQVGDDGLIGTVEMGKPPVDMQPRAQPEGGEAWGFALKDGNRRFQVLAKGLLADQLAMLPDLIGQRVKVFGAIELVVWYKADKAMPPFPRVHATRIVGPDWELPEAEPAEAETLSIFEDGVAV